MEDILDIMGMNEPMKWQGTLMPLDENIESLKAFRTWLSAEWYEKVLLGDVFPEFEFLDDDMMILDMQHELLASLN